MLRKSATPPPLLFIDADANATNLQELKRGRGKKGDGPEATKAGSSANSSAHPLAPLAVEAAVNSYLLDIFRADDSIPPLMVRLAWHDAGACGWSVVIPRWADGMGWTAASRGPTGVSGGLYVSETVRLESALFFDRRRNRDVQRQGERRRARRLHPL